MNDLEFYSNIYADLSQGTYIMRPQSKMFVELDYKQTKEMMEKNYATFSFSHAKDAYGNNANKVYLQPDKLETVKEKMYQKIL